MKRSGFLALISTLLLFLLNSPSAAQQIHSYGLGEQPFWQSGQRAASMPAVGVRARLQKYEAPPCDPGGRVRALRGERIERLLNRFASVSSCTRRCLRSHICDTLS